MNRAFNKPIRTSRKMVITQDYQILIDNRESIIKNYFKDYPNVEFRNLDIGDIIFKYQGEDFDLKFHFINKYWSLLQVLYVTVFLSSK